MTTLYTHTYTMTYKDAVYLFLELTKDTTVKPFSWEIITRVEYPTTDVRWFENALDYTIGLKFLDLVNMYKGKPRRPKTVTFAFHNHGVDILSATGRVIL